MPFTAHIPHLGPNPYIFQQSIMNNFIMPPVLEPVGVPNYNFEPDDIEMADLNKKVVEALYYNIIL